MVSLQWMFMQLQMIEFVTQRVTAVQLTKSNWPGVSSMFVVNTKYNTCLNC